MGTVANWQQHLLPKLLTEPGKELAEALGEPLPANAVPSDSYDGPARLIVPTVRTSLAAGEDLRLKVIAVGAQKARDVALHWRPLGQAKFETVTVQHMARGVYAVRIPAQRIAGDDFEYYVQASIGRDTVYFPMTAPAMNQTVIVTQEDAS
jgi:hypothetical protein